MASDNNPTDIALRQIFRDMDGNQAQEIREAYYYLYETSSSCIDLGIRRGWRP